MEDRVGEVLAQRHALESGAAAGVALSVFLHTAAAVVIVYAATHQRAPQMMRTVSVSLVPISGGQAPRLSRQARAPVLHEPQPVVERTKPEPKTAPPSPFGKSAKKPSALSGAAAPSPPLVTAPLIHEIMPNVSVEGDFPYTIYIQNMNRLIGQHWARGDVKPGTSATLYFEIDRDGTIGDVKIEKPSGNDYYDRAAVRALRETSPLPPLPFAYNGTFLGVHLIFQ